MCCTEMDRTMTTNESWRWDVNCIGQRPDACTQLGDQSAPIAALVCLASDATPNEFNEFPREKNSLRSAPGSIRIRMQRISKIIYIYV